MKRVQWLIINQGKVSTRKEHINGDHGNNNDSGDGGRAWRLLKLCSRDWAHSPLETVYIKMDAPEMMMVEAASHRDCTCTDNGGEVCASRVWTCAEEVHREDSHKKNPLEMMPMKSAGMTPVDACTFTATKICPKAELLMAPFYEYNVWGAHKDNVYGKKCPLQRPRWRFLIRRQSLWLAERWKRQHK